jgi:hypothetical protein
MLTPLAESWRYEPVAAHDGHCASSQRFVVDGQRALPQIVMTVRLPSNTHAATLRTAKPLYHARLGYEMEETA